MTHDTSRLSSCHVRSLNTETSGALSVLGLAADAFGADGVEVGVLIGKDEVRLNGPPQSADGGRRDTEV